MVKVEGSTIMLPAGDTGLQRIAIGGCQQDGDDRAVFCLYSRDKKREYLRRVQEIIDGEAVIRFANEDTQNLPPGDYRWDIRVVIDPTWNEAKDDITGGAEVHAPFAFGALPVLRILEVGAHV